VIDDLRGERVEGAIAFNDKQVLLAAFLADALGLECNAPHVIDRLTDKYAQRAALAAGGIDVPGFRLIPPGTNATVAAAAVAELRLPLVIKPLRGDSSRDVVSVAEIDQLEAALGAAIAGNPGSGFVVEEYLPDGDPASRPGLGGYVSVEAIVQEGTPVPVAVTGKFPLVEPFREAGNFMPHPLGTGEVAGVLDLACRTARALGVHSGALHIEIKLTPAGPRIIEVNGRIGGGAIDGIYQKRTGTSLTELAARVALGQPVELTAETPAEWSGPFTYEFFAQPPTAAARFVGVAGGASIVGTAGAETVAVNREPGDELDWRAGSQGYVLRVGGVASDRSALASVPGALVEAAGIEYDYS
jgi:biotin carboxylase